MRMGTIRSADWISPNAKRHWKQSPCKGARLLASMTAQEFYDASWQSRGLCGRCVARAFKELCKEGKAKKTYWLTGGFLGRGTVMECQGNPSTNVPSIIFVDNSAWGYVLEKEIHETKDAAITHAKKMIAKKLASIDKQRAKLLKMAEELR